MKLPSRDLVNRLAEALGLPPTTTKFAIVADEDCVLRVYVVSIAVEDQVRRVTEAFEVVPVENVEVTDHCDVVVTLIPAKDA